jgi:ketosteroid isomerase-like protein
MYETEEASIRQLLEGWAHAVRRGDLGAVIARHAQSIVYFDVPPPTQVRGLAGYQDSWPPFFACIWKSGQFELSELEICAGADVAFAHAILLVRGIGETETGRGGALA